MPQLARKFHVSSVSKEKFPPAAAGRPRRGAPRRSRPVGRTPIRSGFGLAATAFDPAVAANRTACAFPDEVTLHALIERRVGAEPDRPALFCDHDRLHSAPYLTCGQLNARAN